MTPAPRTRCAYCLHTMLAVVLLLVGSLAPAGAQSARPQRIVSLVPAVTEMLFAIGAGPRVVGVSSYDAYPPDVQTRTRVGALLDPDTERILALRPDLVVVYGSQDTLIAQLTRAHIRVFTYRHSGLADVMTAIRAIGQATGDGPEADRVAAALDARLARLRQRVAGRQPVRTLLVFGREPGTLRQIYASGGTGFLHDMLIAAGGSNVFAHAMKESVQASSEMLLATRAECIVEIRTRRGPSGDGANPREAWRALSSLPAVRAGRIVTLDGDYFVIPGPRVIHAIEALSRALHPDAWTH